MVGLKVCEWVEKLVFEMVAWLVEMMALLSAGEKVATKGSDSVAMTAVLKVV